MTDAKNATDAAHADIGIVCALPLELGAFLSRCDRVRKYSAGDFTFRGGIYDDVRVVVVESGVGMLRAERATHSLLATHSPTWVLSCGFAGALRPEFRIGDIIAVNSVVDGAGGELQIDLGMSTEPARRLTVGRLLTASHVVRTIAEKTRLAEQTAAMAVDMETMAVARVCQDARQKFLAIRVISDDLSRDLPPEVTAIFGDTGAVRLGAVVGSLWKRPGSLSDMWNMRGHAQLAAERLADFLDGVIKQLDAAEHR